MSDGYYWARHGDGTTFVVLREDGCWYACGIAEALRGFDPRQIIAPIDAPQPEHEPSPDCWCEPEETEPGVFIHRMMQ